MSRMSDSMKNMASSWMLKSREPEFQAGMTQEM